MSVTAFRLWNFMGFEDTGWIELRPINLLFGRNGTGKSALLRALLLLRQSLVSPPSGDALIMYTEDGIDAGSFRDILHRPLAGEPQPMTVAFGFRCQVNPDLLKPLQTQEKRVQAQAEGKPEVSPEEAWATLRLDYGQVRKGKVERIILKGVELRWPPLNLQGGPDGTLIFGAQYVGGDIGWWLDTDNVFQKHDPNWVRNYWEEITGFGEGVGFLPRLPQLADNTEAQDKDGDLGAQSIGEVPAVDKLIERIPLLLSRLQNGAVSQAEREQDADELNQILSQVVATVQNPEIRERITYAVRTIEAFRPKPEERGIRNDNKDDYDVVRRLLDEFHTLIACFLTSIHYIAPLRGEPRRVYYVPRASAGRGGGRGRNSLENLLAVWGTSEWEQAKTIVNKRLVDMGLDIAFDAHPLQKKGDTNYMAFEVTLREVSAGTEVNLSDTGVGWSQALPVLIECLLAPAGATMLIEEPEAHLHPGAQALLGDLFIHRSRYDVHFLLETHSETLLLRLQRRIAETTTKTLPDITPHLNLEQDDARIYFVNRHMGVSLLYRVNLSDFGDFTNIPPGFEDFFSEDLIEAGERARARIAAGIGWGRSVDATRN